MGKIWLKMPGTHKHILFAVSSHGYGHLSQIAPVVNALKQTNPEYAVSIQTALPLKILSARIKVPFNHIDFDADVGLIMDDAVTVKTEATRLAYRIFHTNWEDNFQKQLDSLQSGKVDLVVADIPYLPLLAAQKLGIKTIAVCSLNWADILSGYFRQDNEMESYMALMRLAYSQADVFLKPQPSMSMPWLPNSKYIQPLVTTGKNLRNCLLDELALEQKDNTVLVLLALGGIDSQISLENWPDYNNVHIIIQDRPGVSDESLKFSEKKWLHSIQDTSLSFTDIVQSVDVLITKPGYGLFAEAAFGRKPVFYVGRPDWPEEKYLLQWLKDYVSMIEISKNELCYGIEESVIQNLAHSVKTTINKKVILNTGIQQAVDCLIELAE